MVKSSMYWPFRVPNCSSTMLLKTLVGFKIIVFFIYASGCDTCGGCFDRSARSRKILYEWYYKLFFYNGPVNIGISTNVMTREILGFYIHLLTLCSSTRMKKCGRFIHYRIYRKTFVLHILEIRKYSAYLFIF